MLKKLFTLASLAVVTCLAQPVEANDNPRYGYFFTDDDQDLDTFDAVNWDSDKSTSSPGIFVNAENSHFIQIADTGVYLVTYNLTVELNGTDSDAGDVQFALYLNNGELPIPGTTYGVGNAINDGTRFEPQLTGQAVIRIFERNTLLSLNNQCENSVELDDDVGTDNPDDFGFNVSGSIYIQRIDSLLPDRD